MAELQCESIQELTGLQAHPPFGPISTAYLLSENFDNWWRPLFDELIDRHNSGDSDATQTLGFVVLWLLSFPNTILFRKVSGTNIDFMLREDGIDLAGKLGSRSNLIKSAVLRWRPTVYGEHPDERLNALANILLAEIRANIIGGSNLEETIRPASAEEINFLADVIEAYRQTHSEEKSKNKQSRFFERVERLIERHRLTPETFDSLKIRSVVAVGNLYAGVAAKMEEAEDWCIQQNKKHNTNILKSILF